MELQSVKCVAIPKKLIRGEGRGSKPHTTGRHIKNIAMPVRGYKPGGHSSPKRIVTRDRIQRDLKKTDFGLTRSHASSQSEGHELSSQAQAEDRFSHPCGVADESAFAGEIGIPFLLVGALRTSTHDQAGKAIECFWNWLAEVRSNDIEWKTDCVERFAQKTRSVDIAVLYKQDPLVAHNILPLLSNRGRNRDRVREFPEVVRIESSQFNPMAETPRLNSAWGSCAACMSGEFCRDSVFAAIGRIS
jgi:hypothetical protein